MFGLTHAYISSNVLNNIDEELILGSIAPDLVWNDTLIKKQANIHTHAREFFFYVKDGYPDALLFAKGVLLHSDMTGGVDLYSDDPETGYAFINGKIISNDIETLLGIDGKRALDFSHNFVEAALDILLAKNKPELTKQFNTIDSNKQYKKYIPIISSFGSIPPIHVEKAFETLLRFYIRSDYTSISEAVQKSLIPIAVNRFDQEVPVADKLETILNKTINFIQPTYQNEITNIIESIKRNKQLMMLLS
jgi:hypothetical protein